MARAIIAYALISIIDGSPFVVGVFLMGWYHNYRWLLLCLGSFLLFAMSRRIICELVRSIAEKTHDGKEAR
jgi:hypothetical protein